MTPYISFVMAIFDDAHGGYRVFIGDLGKNVGKYELQQELDYYGTVLDVWVARSPPGFAFVVYKHPKDAEKAVADLHGRYIYGKNVRVRHALPYGITSYDMLEDNSRMLCGRRVRTEHARPFSARRGPPRRDFGRPSPYIRRRSRSRSRERRRSRSRVKRRSSRSRNRSKSRSRSRSRSRTYKRSRSSKSSSREKRRNSRRESESDEKKSSQTRKKENGDKNKSTSDEEKAKSTERVKDNNNMKNGVNKMQNIDYSKQNGDILSNEK